jgi:UDP:flavonoid glycosyltransferase YjiC (YdhE family)
MRLLFTTIPASGHFHPLVPLARAVQEAGHEVAFAAPASYCPAVEAVGFRCFPAGFDGRGVPLDDLFPQERTLTGQELALHNVRVIRIGTEARRMAPDLLALAQRWPPDLIVRDAGEYGGCVAAEVLGIPHANVRTQVSASSFARRLWFTDALDALRAAHGLAPDAEVAMPFRYLHLAFEPPGFWPADDPPAPTSHLLRPVPFDRSGNEGLPGWVEQLPPAPTICATLGTYMNRSVETFAAILDALREEDVNLVVTVGRDIDPAMFGPQPERVHIARYIPLSLLLPRCDLVISQSGFSTAVTTLLHGLPAVLIPLGADQPLVARYTAALGAAMVLGPDERTPGAIREATRDALSESAYRRSAERVRDAMLALPGPDYAVELLELLAREKRPILAA